MMPTRPPDYARVVRENWKRTTGYLLAGSQPCLGIRDDELRAVHGRVLLARNLSDLGPWEPPASWILGILVCPNDSLGELMTWVRTYHVDVTRIRFYLHSATPLTVLESWAEAGFGMDKVHVVSDWRSLHKRFGAALNNQVYDDWAPDSPEEG